MTQAGDRVEAAAHELYAAGPWGEFEGFREGGVRMVTDAHSMNIYRKMVGLVIEVLAREPMWTVLEEEIGRQDLIHPAGYPATRDGIRFGIATLEDELWETLDAWRAEKRGDNWTRTEEELLQVVAVGARLLRSLMDARAKRAVEVAA